MCYQQQTYRQNHILFISWSTSLFLSHIMCRVPLQTCSSNHVSMDDAYITIHCMSKTLVLFETHVMSYVITSWISTFYTCMYVFLNFSGLAMYVLMCISQRRVSSKHSLFLFLYINHMQHCFVLGEAFSLENGFTHKTLLPMHTVSDWIHTVYAVIVESFITFFLKSTKLKLQKCLHPFKTFRSL